VRVPVLERVRVRVRMSLRCLAPPYRIPNRCVFLGARLTAPLNRCALLCARLTAPPPELSYLIYPPEQVQPDYPKMKKEILEKARASIRP
jgi:hypothetical protein